MATPPTSWTNGLTIEAGFWDAVLSGKDVRWSDALAQRLERRDLHEAHRALADLSAQGAGEVNILDVGAGPCTVLGCLWPGRRLVLTPVDPLADEYDKQLDQSKRHPPVKTIKGEAETLEKQFGPARFDLVFSHNALDHCYDPILALRQMCVVAKPRACLRLEHRQNEAEVEKYHGLHQWNFCEEKGRFVIWGKDERHDVTSLFGDTHDVICAAKGDWLSITMKPRVRRA
jgi:SAM-dependent methyltransferase